MKTRSMVLLALVAGCSSPPEPIIPPEGMALVTGGLSNTQPYMGTYSPDGCFLGPAPKTGTFLLASCGCGYWRALFKPDDGSQQTSLPVLFYSSGEYDPSGPVVVYGNEDASQQRIIGSLDQAGGAFNGRRTAGSLFETIAAAREDAHQLSVVACGMCHIGEDSIFPLPETHPPDYKTNPLVCLNCHSVDGG